MLRKYPQLKFGLVLVTGALIALALCVQCVRTYLYADAVLVPQQAEQEPARQVSALSAAARTAGITDPRRLGPVIEQTLGAESDRVLCIHVLDPHSNVLAQGGSLEAAPKYPPRWRDRVEKHETLGTLLATPQGKALVVMLPLRIPWPSRPSRREAGRLDQQHRPVDKREPQFDSPDSHGGPPDGPHTAYVLEVAISLRAVAGSFEGLRQNLILGLIGPLRCWWLWR